MERIKNILKLALYSAVVALTSFTPIARASDPIIPIKTAWSVSEVKGLVDYYAGIHNVSRETLRAVIFNESGYDWDNESDYAHGIPTSFGACQIHLPDHPEVTKSQALDPNFCLNWTAEKISEGEGHMWTGYRTCVLGEKVFYEGKQILCQKET